MSKRHRRKLPSVDVSVLEQPLNLGESDAVVLAKALRDGTSEIQHVLVNECNVILECRVCRALFRSLANLLSHKRHYCRASHSDRPAVAVGGRNPEITQIVPVSSSVAAPTHVVRHRDTLEHASSDRLASSHQENSRDQSRKHTPAVKRRTDTAVLTVTRNSREEPKSEERVLSTKPAEGSTKFGTATPLDSTSATVSQLDAKDSPKPLGQVQRLSVNSASSKLGSDFVVDGTETLSSKSNENDHCTDICMRTWQCFTCHLAFDNSYRMRRHLVYDHGTEVRYHLCPRCGFEREYFFEVMRHLHTEHGLGAKQLADLREDVQDRVRYRPRQNSLLGLSDEH